MDGFPALKTNATRILESLGVAHALVPYEVDEKAMDAVSVAFKAGLDPETVFKTLVAIDAHTRVFVFCVPGPSDLNLKKAALAAARLGGGGRVELVPVKDLFALTGYRRGGCSPLGMKKHYPTLIDETALLFEAIHVSAGVRGLQVRLAPRDLAQAAGAEFADLV